MASPSTKPVILAVDDDAPVLRAVERDLRARYGKDYRIVAAGSGAEALDVVRQLTVRGGAIGLFVVDQRMPGMTGIEFLAQALELQPDAKRVLLTAYADTDAAIRAINQIRLDQYILKPWDPPEEKLYPVTDDLLSDWIADFRPPFEGLRLLARRWSPRGHDIRDYLARNQVPYAWLDPETDEEGRRLAASVAQVASGAVANAAAVTAGEAVPPEPAELMAPLVLFPDGTVLRDPSTLEIAEKVGLQTHAALPFYDLVIVGGWPVGAGCGGLRRKRGPEDGPCRARGAGWPGGDHQPDRELPGIPRRAGRQRSRAARPCPGAPPRRGDPVAAGGRGNSAR